MAFFDDLSKSVTKLGQDVSQKTKSITDGMKINNQLTEQKRQLAGIYETLGRAVFREASIHDNPEYAKLVEMIENGEANVKNLEKQLEQSKGRIVCRQCGAEVAAGNAFCQRCGMKVDGSQPNGGPQPQPNAGMQPNEGTQPQPNAEVQPQQNIQPGQGQQQ